MLAAVLAFAVGFGLWGWLGAKVTCILGEIGPMFGGGVHIDPAIRPAVFDEIWIRTLAPPPLQNACYTNNTQVCQVADEIAQVTETTYKWDAYLLGMGLDFVSFLTASFMTWLFTKRRQG